MNKSYLNFQIRIMNDSFFSNIIKIITNVLFFAPYKLNIMTNNSEIYTPVHLPELYSFSHKPILKKPDTPRVVKK